MKRRCHRGVQRAAPVAGDQGHLTIKHAMSALAASPTRIGSREEQDMNAKKLALFGGSGVIVAGCLLYAFGTYPPSSGRAGQGAIGQRQVYRAEQPKDASVNPDAAPVAMAAITEQMKSHQLPELQNGQIFQLNSGEMYQLNNGKLLALRDGMTFQLKNDQMLQLQHGQFYLMRGNQLVALQPGQMYQLNTGAMLQMNSDRMFALKNDHMFALKGGEMFALKGGQLLALKGGEMFALSHGELQSLMKQP